jgi:hypothetical protein
VIVASHLWFRALVIDRVLWNYFVSTADCHGC